ncbi:MotA/TolQ/ExbB proton channel family protein [Hydrogenothermus marinus]|uniref:Biopolymer transport protein ExbB n=1 Tax=Hydrogenothermus marinus TaxID=133270 RepID=A0A3M0BJ99_9AQUI|nr:MotA/TolQ/ExbB proton channel family protein [Hydrogenothermus marinus]RMA97281.1 biopolymer transport protein ExbB [Hydrogenothermus marinus]
MEYIINIFQKGGIFMYPLLFLGILSIAFIIERFYSLRLKKIIPIDIIKDILDFIQERKIEEARTVAKTYKSVATNIIFEILNAYLKGRKNPEDLKIIAEEVAKIEIPKIEGYVNAIGAIAAIAPLLGFLGTVTGMIQVFEALSVSGLENPQVLSSGISQALLTTAFGLTIAIPSLAAYWYFRSKVNFLITQLENIALETIYELSYEEK